MNNKLTTFEREMKDEQFKKSFDKSYKELLLSELLIAIAEDDQVSIKNLAGEIGK